MAIKIKLEIAARFLLIAAVLFNALAPTISASANSSTQNSALLSNAENGYQLETFIHPSPRLAQRSEAEIADLLQIATPTPTVTPSINAVALCSMPSNYTYQVFVQK